VTALPLEVEVRLRRRDAAGAFRRGIANNPARDELWMRYRHGAEWFGVDWQTGSDRGPTHRGLNDAERDVPFLSSAP
jgi:hypothetical protein